MNRFTKAALSTLALAATPAFADGHAGTMGYALADDGATLLVMPSIAAPGEVQSFALATPLDAIAFRPVTGELVGYTNGAIYTVNAMTGELTDAGASYADGAMISDGAVTAFDFNNAIDAVRAVSTAGENLVYFPAGFGDNDERANSVRRFTDLAYAAEDVSAAATPMIYANAYTNAVPGAKAGSTVQYALDAETDALVTLANNDGTLATVAAVTLDGVAMDLAPVGGLDIVSPVEGQDAAYAVLQTEGADSAGLYAVDLETGAVTLLADLGMTGIHSFAVSMGM